MNTNEEIQNSSEALDIEDSPQVGGTTDTEVSDDSISVNDVDNDDGINNGGIDNDMDI